MDARRRVLETGLAGDLSALVLYDDLEKEATLAEIGETLAQTLDTLVAEIISDARDGKYVFRGYRIGALRAMINLSDPSRSDWRPLLALLKEPRVSADEKRALCEFLADQTPDLPQHLLRELKAITPSIRQAGTDLFSSQVALEVQSERLSYRLQVVTGVDLAAHAFRFASSPASSERHAAAVLLGENLVSEGIATWPTLIRLAADDSPSVSLRAFNSLGRQLPEADARAMELVTDIVTNSARGSGQLLAFLTGLAHSQPPVSSLARTTFTSSLGRHPSRAVRDRTKAIASSRPVSRAGG